MARWRIAVGAGIVVALAVVAAFVLSSAVREEPEVAASEPVTGAASPSPTATADPDPMPELHNTGEDFDRIYRSIEDFRNWLFRNPNPALTNQIYHYECECFSETRRRLQLLVDEELRFSTNETVVSEVSVLAQDSSAVALKVIKKQLEQIVTSRSDGAVVDEDPPSEPEAFRFLLVNQDGEWLVRDVAEIPPHFESSDRDTEST